METNLAARIAVVAVSLAVGVSGLLASATPAASRTAASLYAGPGFDTCSAPPLATMQSWLASPYRAVGVYIGGVNRACPDGNLSAAWTAGAVTLGWNLLPLYVGLQAPCVAPPGLALIDPSAAAGQGTAAADDAVARAAAFGLGPGNPIYFDMEGYNTSSPACTRTVQAFLGAWAAGLRSRGYLAGVYGSAASTVRDLIPSAADPSSGPDAVWIADWNGKTGVFGDPYVPDTLWAGHQRIHQYTGGHRETYAGVTVNIDSNSVDGPVAGRGGVAPIPTPPPLPQPVGSLTSADGQATVTWPGTAFAGTATVTSSRLPTQVGGFAAGSYVLQLSAVNPDGSQITRFGAPLTVSFHLPAPGTVPAFAPDGTTWQVLRSQATGSIPAGSSTVYTRLPDGSVRVTTLVPGSIGLLRDIAPPTTPAALTGRFVRGRLLLNWQPSTDNSGSIARYQITLNGRPLAAASPTTPAASVLAFYPSSASVFRVTAQDAAGNTSARSGAVVVRPAPRPTVAPRSIPGWAYQLAAWQAAGRAGARPAAPGRVPSWYWSWRSWRLHPFRLG